MPFHLILNIFLLILGVFAFGSCNSQRVSNLNVAQFEGFDLNGKLIKLDEIPASRIALNVYSPTCVPCVKEIPVLNHVYREISKNESLKFYMVVDPALLIENPAIPESEQIKQATEIMKKEVIDKKIELPILIMKSPFKVIPEGGLITGTPETLLFKTKPLTLYYNFIGPISEKSELSEIQKENKVKFFIKTLGGS